MRKMFFVFIAVFIVIFPFVLIAEESDYQIPVNDDGIEAVAIETARGDVFVAFITKETKDEIYVQNLNDTIETILERSEVANIRKPSKKEIEKTKERLGMTPAKAPAQVPAQTQTEQK